MTLYFYRTPTIRAVLVFRVWSRARRVKVRCRVISDAYRLSQTCLLLIILRGLQTGGEEVVWLRQHSAMPRPTQSSTWIHTLYIYYVIYVRYSVNTTIKLWFCCSLLYMPNLLHVWLLLRILPSFSLNMAISFSLFTAQIVKPTAAMCLGIFDI